MSNVIKWILAFGLTTPAMAEFDPCTDPETVALNSWLLTVNDGNVASREGLLQTLELLGTGGFSISGVFPTESQDVTVFFRFDPGYWADPMKAGEIKNMVLESLSNISGNLLRCDPLAFPAPAIGVR